MRIITSKACAASERGSALLAVLWLSAVLATIAFSLASTVHGEAERASTAVESARSYYLAVGAVRVATLRMLWGKLDRDMPVSRLTFPTGEVEVEVLPEASRLNINNILPEELFRLLGNLGVEPERARTIALAILDWRSPAPGNQMTPFDEYYSSLQPSFRARHASLEEIEELLVIEGMTPDIYYGTYESAPEDSGAGAARLVARPGLADCVSVYGSTQVDVNTAAPPVLATLGLSPDLVAQIVELRRRRPLGKNDMGALMQAAGPAAGRLRLGGNTIYTLRATARLRLPDGRLSDLKRTVGAMVKFMPEGYDAPYHILRWYDWGVEGRN